MTSKIYILDTCDHFILAFQKCSIFNKNIIDKVLDLYADLDITINTTELEFEVSDEIKEFIKSICGRIIPYSSKKIHSDDSDLTILQKLKKDIYYIIDFYKIKKFWNSFVSSDTTKAVINIPIKIEEFENYAKLPECFDEKILPDDFGKPKPITNSYCMDNAIYEAKILLSDSHTDISNKTYILLNNIYNITLVVEDDLNIIPEICKEFLEFEIMGQFIDIFDIPLKQFFHKKSFTREELVKKIESFKNLYNMDLHTLTEKEKVFNFLKNYYILNTDPNNKISASELYNNISNNLLISYTELSAFKKRLAGYLIELGLVKKRYSEGFFYYGIKNRFEDKENLSVDEIIIKRSLTLKEKCPSV
jgi:hypothetical protein